METIDKAKGPDEIEKELSVGNFAKQQARTLGFTVGGAVVGYFGGKQLAKTGFTQKVAGWIAGKGASEAEVAAKTGLAKQAVTWGTAAVGYVAGQIAAYYEHWVKGERERLSVQEINKDVANIMEKRVQFEDTLDKQHKIVTEMLAKQETVPSSMQEKVLAKREQAASAEPTLGA